MPGDKPLYVRLPEREAELLDRAAFEAKVAKRQLVTEMVQSYLGGTPLAADGRDVKDVGRHDFRPAPDPEVLTLDEAAELLRTEPETLAELAAKGALPGRRLGGEWRFARSALLAWLGGGS